jgi:hypothetical protein
MNPEKKTELSSSIQESEAAKEEMGFSGEEGENDYKQALESYKEEKSGAVRFEAQSAKEIPDVVAIMNDAGYSPEECENILQETGVLEALEENRRQIDALEADTRQRIADVGITGEDMAEAPYASSNMSDAKEPGNKESVEKEKIMEAFCEGRAGILERTLKSEMISSGLDFVPVVGGVKMTLEGVAGKTLSGKKLERKARIIHAGMGVATCALDFTGIGEAGKGAIIAGKGVAASEKLALKLAERGAVRGEKIVARGVELMKNNPELTRQAEEILEAEARRRIQEVREYAKNNMKENE